MKFVLEKLQGNHVILAQTHTQALKTEYNFHFEYRKTVKV